MLTAIRSLVPQGGTVPCIDVLILKRYPVLFFEKLSSGKRISRNIYGEEKERARQQVIHRISFILVLIPEEELFHLDSKSEAEVEFVKLCYVNFC
jgi:hypothetical protein